MSNIDIKWTEPALQQVRQMSPSDCSGEDPKIWHEKKVRDHAAVNVPHANKARIRKPAHVGGTNESEALHITVTYKANNRNLGAWHVYTTPPAN